MGTGTKESAAMGRTFTHPGKGDAHVSPSHCAPTVLQSVSRTAVSTVLLQGMRILSLLVHVQSVSVNVAGLHPESHAGSHPLENRAPPKHLGRQGPCSLDCNAQILPAPTCCHKAHD